MAASGSSRGSVAMSGAASSSSSWAPRRGAAGGLVDHPQLTQLSAMLRAIDAGDRIVKGRLELFYCTKRPLTVKAQQDILRICPDSLADSPLGPLTSEVAQQLLANMRALMSLLFVDYDCASVMPHDFERCTDKHTVVATINQTLAAVVDRVHSGFLAEFWQAVQESVDFLSCEIFAFRPASGSFGPADKSLTSFHYFFIEQVRGRILFIGSVTKSKGSVGAGVDSDSDVVLSQESASSVSQQGGSSDMGSSLQEGELAFSSGGGSDDGMMD